MQKARGLETSWVFQEVDCLCSCIKGESQRVSLGHLRLIRQGRVGIYRTPHPRPRRPKRRDWARMREKMLARGVRVSRSAGAGRSGCGRPPAPAAPPRGPGEAARNRPGGSAAAAGLGLALLWTTAGGWTRGPVCATAHPSTLFSGLWIATWQILIVLQVEASILLISPVNHHA